jgi:DNA-directed RNA polymerase specialized sigma24 family protein
MQKYSEKQKADLLEYVAYMEQRASEERRYFLEQKYAAIAAFRDKHGLSLAELAEVLGVSRPRAHQLVSEARETVEGGEDDG